MRKLLMGVIAALIAIALSVVGYVPANASGGTSVTVESVSYAETSAKAEVTSETRAVIDGATQVSWEVPNHHIRVTKKQLKKAVRIKVNATGANSSKVIFKTAVKKLMRTKNMSRAKAVKAAGIVVLKKGSCVRNTGRENRLRVGFVWCLSYDAVLVFNKQSQQYRHAYNIRGGKLYKTCLNFIGGKVPMRKKVVQVRYEQDVLMDIELESTVSVSATVKASLQCPTGTLYGEASASANGYAAASIRVKIRERITAINAKKVEILTAARAKAKTAAEAAAMARVTLTCGETPPPAYEAPAASGNAKACVKPGEANGIITATGVNPNSVAAPGTLTIGGQTKQFDSVGAGQSVTWDFSGFAPGTYSGSFLLGSPVNKSATFNVTVNECEYQPGSIVEVTDINDVLYGNTRTWRIRGVVPEGQSAVLKVSARIGTVKESDKSISLGSGAFDLNITYTAPTEGSSDTLTATLFGPDGVMDDEASDTFELRPNPVDPL